MLNSALISGPSAPGLIGAGEVGEEDSPRRPIGQEVVDRPVHSMVALADANNLDSLQRPSLKVERLLRLLAEEFLSSSLGVSPTEIDQRDVDGPGRPDDLERNPVALHE